MTFLFPFPVVSIPIPLHSFLTDLTVSLSALLDAAFKYFLRVYDSPWWLFNFSTVLVCFSIVIMLWLKTAWGKRGLFGLTSYSPLWKKVRAEIESRNLSREHEGRLFTGMLFMTCSTCFLINLPRDDTSHSGVDTFTSIINQENASQTYPSASLPRWTWLVSSWPKTT